MQGIKGVSFDTLHSYRDFSLYLSKKTIESPKPKTETQEVPGADVELDFTEFFGDVKFENRTLKFEFSTLVPQSEFSTLFSKIQNALNGRKMKIVLDEDAEFYYVGRVSVKEWQADGVIGKLSVECDCEPYKYKQDKTVKTISVAGTQVVQLSNLRQHVVPKFNTTAAIQIVFNGGTYSVSTTGDFTIPDLVLKDGDNQITLKGTATVRIEYQEGSL